MSTAAAVPVVRPLPAWLRQRYVIAAAAALVVGPTLWLVRNFVSDHVFYKQTLRLRSEQAYQSYINAGWLHVGEVRRELPRVALDQAKRKQTTAALRDFLTRYPRSPVDAEGRETLDRFYRTTLEAARPSGPVEPVSVDELLGILGRMDPAKVNAAALAAFIPAQPTGADCGKEWRARLPGEASATKALLARGLLRGGCDEFLKQLVGKDRALLELYRGEVEKELGRSAASTPLAFRQMRDYGTVKANAALFSPTLGAEMLKGIRASSWFPNTMPDPDHIEKLKLTFSRDAALTEAALDYMQQNAGSWTAPAGSIEKDTRLRAHMNKLLELSRQVGSLGRPALAAQIARPAEAAFHAEVDAVAKRGTAEIVRFFGADAVNPFAGDLADKLAAAGKTLLAYSFVGSGGSFEGAIQGRLASAAGDRLLVLPCAGPGCGRIPMRVRIRVSQASNAYCYDKYFAGFGTCSNRGQQISVTLSYFKNNQPLGSDVVSAETPDVVRYRTSGGFDPGPSSSDVYSATVEAMNARLGTAKLRLPF